MMGISAIGRAVLHKLRDSLARTPVNKLAGSPSVNKIDNTDATPPSTEAIANEETVESALELARANYFAALNSKSSHPPYGTRWDHFRLGMAEAIRSFSSAKDAISFGQLKCGFDHRGIVSQDDIPQMKTAQHLLQYEYQQFSDKILLLSETPATTPGTAIEFEAAEGRRVFVSNILYFHSSYLLSILRFKPDVDSICEIGGGYGNPALIWLTNPIKRVSRYAIVDIPESLFFAEIFLRTAAPDIAIHYATEAAPVSDKPGIALVPIQLASQTDRIPFDIVVNTGSMAEMTDEWVDYWRDWLDRQTANLFYSFNFFGNPVDRLHEARSRFAPTVAPGWHPAYVRPMHPMMLLHSSERMAAEIIFERLSSGGEAPLGAVLEFFSYARISLENYIYIVYALLREIDRNHHQLMPFSNKVIADFGYAPVELLYLLAKIETDDPDVLALRKDLQQKFEANYPQGAYSN